MANQIIIEDYNPDWASHYDNLKAIYTAHLGPLLSDIQHVGSTSVPGLAAKPVIDIDLIIPDKTNTRKAISALKALGYEHIGDMGIKGREAFRRSSDHTPEDGSARLWPRHNLYLCEAGCTSLRNHLTLRDSLRKDPQLALQYATLKRKLAAEYPHDIDAYVRLKTPFILEILAGCGFDEDELQDIGRSNGL